MRLSGILLIIFAPVFAFSGEIDLEGTYQGDNLYVKNPNASSGVGFCVYEVLVNGTTTTDEINSNSFEVDLSVFRLALGDPVHVTIRYKDGCEPSVVNPDVVAPRVSYEVEDIALKNNKLILETSEERGSLPFRVEQYRWNKWVQVGEVKGKGVPGHHRYEVPVRLHSGENRFRVVQTDSRNDRKTSPEVTMDVNKSEVTLKSEKVEDKLIFSEPTLFEIYDISGRIVFKGFNDTVAVADLEEGEYYLNYDNQMSVFLKQ